MLSSSQPNRAPKRRLETAEASEDATYKHKKIKTTLSDLDAAELDVQKPLTGSDVGQEREKRTRLDAAGDKRMDSNVNSKDASRNREGEAKEEASKAKNVEQTKPSHKVRKLAPPRPFPTVPTSVSATGPKSQHKEGKNWICITRRTALGGYLRRCKELVMKDGYRELHLHALGAAIPHLARLSVSLPTILPFASDEIHSEVKTGTVELHDELIPEDEDEDISMRTRGKSTMSVTIIIGDGRPQSTATQIKQAKSSKQKRRQTGKVATTTDMEDLEEIVFQEDDQESDLNG